LLAAAAVYARQRSPEASHSSDNVADAAMLSRTLEQMRHFCPRANSIQDTYNSTSYSQTTSSLFDACCDHPEDWKESFKNQ
jgi:hypothetical protein